MKRTQVGLAGCGIWGRLILRDLLALGADVIVAEPTPEGRTAAATLGARALVIDPADLPEVDAIVVATPAVTHADVVTSLVQRGTPMLVEKPFTTDVESAERLARDGGGRLFVGHVWRYHPGIELLGQIAHSGEIGSACGLRSTRTNWTSPRTDVDSIWNLAPHDLTLAIEILGTIPAPRGAVAEVHAGRAVGLTALLGHDPWQVFEVSNRYTDRRREVRLHCQGGVAVMAEPDGGFIEIVRGDARSPSSAIERRSYGGASALRRELQAFLDYVAGGSQPKSDATEGLTVVSAVCALRRLAGLSDMSPLR